MSDTTGWKGRRLGPYEIGERYPGIPEDEGQLHEAHRLDTGEPALVMTPGEGEDWRTSTPWSVEVTNFTEPEALVLQLKRVVGGKWPTFHELTLGFIRLAGTLAPLDEREDTRAHVMHEPRSSRSRLGTKRWMLAGVGLALAAILALLLWPRTHPTMRDLRPDDPFLSTNGQDLDFPAIAYQMPEKPFDKQRTPPCRERLEVEIRGGCWIPHALTAPCPPGAAEYQGKCYLPVKKPDPQPSSVKP